METTTQLSQEEVKDKDKVYTAPSGEETHYPPDYEGVLGGAHNAIGFLAARHSTNSRFDPTRFESYYETLDPNVIGKMLLEEFRLGIVDQYEF